MKGSILAVAGLCCVSAFAQKFEAADIRVSPPPRNPYNSTSGGVLLGERYDIRKATMLDLIQRAWNVDSETVVGGPSWLELDRFDLSAKAPSHTPAATIRLMLQSLLRERFDLDIHQDVRPMPAFALRLAKGSKPNLRESSSEDNPGCRIEPSASQIIASAVCRGMTMSDFARWLRLQDNGYLRMPLFDATGLNGSWDFELEWNWRTVPSPAGVQRITIFDAVEKQLGLVLNLETAPAPVMVVDHVNEKASPNAADIDSLLPARPIEFEVANLRPSRPDATDANTISKLNPGGRIELRAWNLKDLILYAFDIHSDHPQELTSGVPGWADSARFDLDARPSAEIFGPQGSLWSNDDIRLMTRNLLIERFRMKVHYEDRPVTAYSLVAVKPRLKPADPSHRANCREGGIMTNDPRDSNPTRSRLVVCQNVTMAQFAGQLLRYASGYFAVPVEDATGLAGAFDLTVSFSRIGVYQGDEGKDPANDSVADPNGAISFFDAVSKQLGLKLERRKRIASVLVIDHMEQKPLEN